MPSQLTHILNTASTAPASPFDRLLLAGRLTVAGLLIYADRVTEIREGVTRVEGDVMGVNMLQEDADAMSGSGRTDQDVAAFQRELSQFFQNKAVQIATFVPAAKLEARRARGKAEFVFDEATIHYLKSPPYQGNGTFILKDVQLMVNKVYTENGHTVAAGTLFSVEERHNKHGGWAAEDMEIKVVTRARADMIPPGKNFHIPKLRVEFDNTGKDLRGADLRATCQIPGHPDQVARIAQVGLNF